MHIREIDRFDEALTRRFWEVGKAADEQGRPWSAFWSWPAARAAFTADDAPLEKVLLGAFEDDRLVGAAEVSLPRLDNTHVGWLEVYVDPPHQRRGVGRALAEAAMTTAAEHDRGVLMLEAATPLEGPESAGLRLARGLGFRTEVVDEMKVVDLVDTEHLWGPILAETETRARGYRLRSWQDVCPDDLVEGYCTLLESFNTESPSGDLDLEPERWDERRLREKEERFRRGGRHETTTVAIEPDGAVVGMTEVMVSEHAPDRGFQGATLVSPAHRGHRLGLRLKVVNQRLVREGFPTVRRLLTGNADVNVAMNAVNDRLGYAAVELVHEMQRGSEGA